MQERDEVGMTHTPVRDHHINPGDAGAETGPPELGDVGAGAGPPELGDALAHLLRVMERTSAQLSARRGDSVDKAAFGVLLRLLQDGPQRSSALAESLLADPSTVSRHVTHLVGLGHVERTADPDDGRATMLAATDAGRAFARSLRTRRNTTVAGVVAAWPETDRTHLTTLLTRFTTDLEHHRPQLLADATPTRPEGDPA